MDRMDLYEKLEKLGEGAHGVVTKARVRTVEEVRRFAKQQQQPAETSSEERIDIQVPGATTGSTTAVTTNTPKKRKFDGNEEEAKSNTTIDDDGDVEVIEPIELPTEPNTIVAIKKIRLRSAAEGLSMEAIREIKLLQELDHPNVLKMLDIFSHHSNINLVLEYMTGDLEGLIRNLSQIQKPLPPADIKAYMKMILQGMEHCHQRWIMHRDMKPGNLLIGVDGQLKIGTPFKRVNIISTDFGLAKIYGSPDRRMSPQACTIWYRAPELLLGATSYGAAADMWSIGPFWPAAIGDHRIRIVCCIMGEMLWMKPMFAGPESELQQLQRIFALLGTPSQTDWPNLSQLRHYIHFKPQAGHTIRELFGAISDDAAELLTGLLTLNPQKRMTATEALQHRYFREKPQPTPLNALPKIGAKVKPPPKVIDRTGKASGKVLNFDASP